MKHWYSTSAEPFLFAFGGVSYSSARSEDRVTCTRHENKAKAKNAATKSVSFFLFFSFLHFFLVKSVCLSLFYLLSFRL